MREHHIPEYSLFFLFRALLFPLLFFMPVLLEEKGITGWRTGLLIGEAYITGILLTVPHGILNDRVQSRRLILVSLILASLFLFLLTQVSAFGVMLLLFLLFGVARNLFQISFDSLFFKQVIRGEGCVHVGRYCLVFSSAAILGFALTSALLSRWPLYSLYIIAGILYGLTTALTFFLRVNETRRVALSEYAGGLGGWRAAALLFILFLFSLHWGAEDTCYGLFLKHYLGLSPSLSALYMGAEFITFGLTAYGTGLMVDRRGWEMRKVFLAGIVLSGLSLILQVNRSFEISLAMRMLHGMGDALVMVIIYYGISRAFHVDRMGGHMSLVMVILLLGSFTGSLVYSRVGKTFGYETSFLVSGVIMLVTAFLLITYFLSAGRGLNPAVSEKKPE